jgi:hypothetical protein
MLTFSTYRAGQSFVEASPYLWLSAPAGGAPGYEGYTMTQQVTKNSTLPDGGGAYQVTAPDVAIRVVGAMLALTVAAVHIADQGGVTALTSPSWIGWGYRTVEVGGVLTALVLLLPRPARLTALTAWTGWAAGVLLGVGPFVAYILSRSVGVPGDSGDVGNWGYWVGTVSLFIEAALMVLSVSMLLALRQSARNSLRDLVAKAQMDY